MGAFTFDELLVRRMLDGDREALGALYDINAAAAYALALSMCGSPRAAQEAVTRTFLDLWEGRGALKPAGESFSFYVYSVLRRHCRTLRTGRESGQAKGTFGERDYGDLLSDLPGQEREALTLVFLRGYDEYEASEAIGTTPAGVRALVRRGLERLSEPVAGEADAR